MSEQLSSLCEARARALVFPLASTIRTLEWYLMKRIAPRGRHSAGYPLVAALESLRDAEKHARAMFPFDPTGL